MIKYIFLICFTPLLLWGDVSKPNVILIFTDDQGYNDLSCYGSTKHKTPNIDTMAKEGIRFTDFYVAANFCSPSRVGLLTGCYPGRLGIGPGVLRPDSEYGVHPKEFTMAEMFKSAGYVTSCIGKWHIGFKEPFLPNNQGFDEYFGIYHNMDPYEMTFGEDTMSLYRNEKAIEQLDTPATLTERYTEEAIKFITKNKDNPFFLYLPHTMAHKVWAVTDRFSGKSKGGLFGDVVECLDWSTGEILEKVKELGLDSNTIVLYISDNGGFKGRNAPLRGSKGHLFEGGFRVPAIVWGPGIIPEGVVSSEIASTIDLLPTFAKWLNVDLPNPIDGQDISPLLTTKKAKGRASYCYFDGERGVAIRDERFKLYKTVHGDYRLYDLQNDISEKEDVIKKHPRATAYLKRKLLDYEYDLMVHRRLPGRMTE
ncbi:MAG: sulfatase [Planctomycetes bacterium]|nr:sulfatase [Planctomycetota bacterium]